MAKILFVNPVVREDDVPRHVPYGIALLAAIADQEGHLVQVFDQNAWRQPQDVVRRVFDADDWDVIAMGGITTTYGSVKELSRSWWHSPARSDRIPSSSSVADSSLRCPVIS